MVAHYRVVTSCPQTALEGGTLTSSAAGFPPAPSTAREGMEQGWRGSAGVVGTLLGPEGTGSASAGGSRWGWGLLSPPGLPGSQTATRMCGLVGSWWGSAGLVVENCTVDASIFDSLYCRSVHAFGCAAGSSDARVRVFVGLCVAKMLRAHGGCLGTRSR